MGALGGCGIRPFDAIPALEDILPPDMVVRPLGIGQLGAGEIAQTEKTVGR